MTEKEWVVFRKGLWFTARKRARANGLDFDIKVEDLEFPEDGLCPILKQPMDKHRGKIQRLQPSLDRKDSTKGYVRGNVFVISWFANYCKANMTHDQLIRLAEYSKI